MSWFTESQANIWEGGWLVPLVAAFNENIHPAIGPLVLEKTQRSISMYAGSAKFSNNGKTLFVRVHFQPTIAVVNVHISVSTRNEVVGNGEITFKKIDQQPLRTICNQVVLEAYKIIDKELEFSKTMGIEKGW